MKVHAAVALTASALVCAGACRSRETSIADAVPGVPMNHQRAISRAEFGFRWPLSPGVGVLACDPDGAILFRTQGTTYELSGGPGKGSDIQALRVPEGSGPPSNPLRRIKQEDRMHAFESVTSCASHPNDTHCVDDRLQRLGLSRDDWALIDAEGKERQWPPLTHDMMALDPLLAAGRELCTK